jgi:hypothetical protein
MIIRSAVNVGGAAALVLGFALYAIRRSATADLPLRLSHHKPFDRMCLDDRFKITN